MWIASSGAQPLHGRLAAAVSMNPLMVVFIPILGTLFFNSSWIRRRWIPWAALGVLITYGLARNIPTWPFVLLAPG